VVILSKAIDRPVDVFGHVRALPGRRQAWPQLLSVARKGSQLLVGHFLKANRHAEAQATGQALTR
jgi:hypothetical protein